MCCDKTGASVDARTKRRDLAAIQTAQQWTIVTTDELGRSRFRTAQLDVVVTVPGRDELEWLDATARRSTAVNNVRASSGGFATSVGERNI